MRVLRPNETLEGLLNHARSWFNAMSDYPGRPVYLASMMDPPFGDAHERLFRAPGATEYIKMNALERFLCPWQVSMSWDRYIRPTEVDLEAAEILYLVTPALPPNPPNHENYIRFPEMRQMGSRPIPVIPEKVPEELRPFIFNWRPRRPDPGHPAIRFHYSDQILVPKEQRAEWSHGLRFTPESQCLLPPGGHSPAGDQWPGAESWNRYLRVEQDPGDCILCGGASGDRVHFGHVTWGPKAYATGLICRTCFPKFAEGILQALK